MLIGEISEPQLRGAFASGAGLAYAMGILSVYVLGSLLPWRIVAALSTVLPITSLLMLSTMPESPVWLVIQGNTDEARKSLLRLRGGDNNKVSPRPRFDQNSGLLVQKCKIRFFLHSKLL